MVVGLGTGVAAAVTVRGAVLAGHHGAAGEIGYAVTGGRGPARCWNWASRAGRWTGSPSPPGCRAGWPGWPPPPSAPGRPGTR
ncbi:hypothetical protein [Micromonospora olivasterospora]|uniref:hypothetical protein n=1 Tax=Micromonospora olivasterospora TaxID=1880 RepID=UPI001FE77550|nr:hypothetical protein [Micromonospora olivasterospora]